MYFPRAALLHIVTLEIENTVLGKASVCLSHLPPRFLCWRRGSETLAPLTSLGRSPFSLVRWEPQLREVNRGGEKHSGHSWPVLPFLRAPLFWSSFHGAPALSADLSAGSTLLQRATQDGFFRGGTSCCVAVPQSRRHRDLAGCLDGCVSRKYRLTPENPAQPFARHVW